MKSKELVLALGLVAAAGCAERPKSHSTSTPGVATPATSPDTPAHSKEKPMSSTITFHPDRVYEVTGIWIKDGAQDDLGAYFSQVFPIAQSKYGVEPLFSLRPVNVYAGDFRPDMFFVNEWPSLEQFQAFTRDEAARALFPQRDAAVERMVVTHYKVPQTSTVTLEAGQVVEFGAMWIKDGQEEALGAYYKDAFAIAQNHGIAPITGLSPIYSYSGDFMPSRAGLNLWGTLDNFKAFAREAEPLFSRRDATLERLEVTHAEVQFGSGT